MRFKVTSKLNIPRITSTWNASNWSSMWGQMIWMTLVDWRGLLWPWIASWPFHKNLSGYTEVLKRYKLWHRFRMFPILFDLWLHCIALHCTALPWTALHCTLLQITSLFCPTMQCIALFWTIVTSTVCQSIHDTYEPLLLYTCSPEQTNTRAGQDSRGTWQSRHTPYCLFFPMCNNIFTSSLILKYVPKIFCLLKNLNKFILLNFNQIVQ